MSRFSTWAERTLREVEQDGEATARIRCVGEDGSTWQTWECPLAADEFVSEAEALVSELAQELSGECDIMFIAESVSGAQRSQCTRTVNGRKKRAFGKGALDANAMATDALAKTMKTILASANVQIEVLTRTVSSQGTTVSELLEYIKASREAEALAKTSEGVNNEVLGQLLEHVPGMLELLKARKGAKKISN